MLFIKSTGFSPLKDNEALTNYFWENINIISSSSALTSTNGSKTMLTRSLGGNVLPATVVGSSNFKFNLVWDSTVSSSTFQVAIESAATAIANMLTDKITINVGINNSGSGGGASAGPSATSFKSYSWVYAHLNSDNVTFNFLPNTISIQGKTNIALSNAQLKLWGVSSTGSLDGSAQFAKDISPSAIFGVALHEFTHALGRVPYGSDPNIFDLFRFTAPGVMLFSNAIPSSLAYFSIDGGVTNLAYYGIKSDPSDFYNGTPSGKMHSVYSSTYDAFSEFYYANGASNQYVSALDLHNLVALGFHISPLAIVSAGSNFATTPVIVADTALNIQNNLDMLNASVNSIYSITQSDSPALNISAKQSVDDSSILELMNLYEKLYVNVSGTLASETIYGIGNDLINGCGGKDSISLLCHTSSTIDTICFNSAVSSSNLDMVSGFLSTDKIQLVNSASSLNGLTDLGTGSAFSSGSSVANAIQLVSASKAFTVSTSGIDMLDIVGATFTDVSALIKSFSSHTSGSAYITFGSTIAAGSHFLVEYSATDGVHIAEITQGANSNHLVNASGVDLIDLVGVTSHPSESNFTISAF